MIDIGCFDEDAACVVMRRLRNQLRRVVFERSARAAETIESYNTFDEEAA